MAHHGICSAQHPFSRIAEKTLLEEQIWLTAHSSSLTMQLSPPQLLSWAFLGMNG
jgi:hypothetical protein